MTANTQTLTEVGSLVLRCRRETRQFAELLAPLLRAGDLVILSGDFGSGKTFFSRRLAHALGLPHGERVTSPTFTLVHELDTKPPMAHADLYRLAAPDEVYELGLRDRRGDGAIVVVEWGEPHIHALGGDPLVLRFQHAPEGRRVTLAVHPAHVVTTILRGVELARNLLACTTPFEPLGSSNPVDPVVIQGSRE